MIAHDEYIPPAPVEPLALAGDELERYLEIRMLRLLFDSTGARAVTWEPDGEARPGIRYPQPPVYSFTAGPSE